MSILITKELVMSWFPCGAYPETLVASLAGEGVTIEEMLELDIPTKDKKWLINRLIKDPSVEFDHLDAKNYNIE